MQKIASDLNRRLKLKVSNSAAKAGVKKTGEFIHAAQLIAVGVTIRDTAEQVGVSTKTISEWKKTDAFTDTVDMFTAQDAFYAALDEHTAARVAGARIYTSPDRYIKNGAINPALEPWERALIDSIKYKDGEVVEVKLFPLRDALAIVQRDQDLTVERERAATEKAELSASSAQQLAVLRELASEQGLTLDELLNNFTDSKDGNK